MSHRLDKITVFCAAASLPVTALAQQAATDRQSGLSQILVAFLIGVASSLAVLWMSGWRPGRQTYKQESRPPVLDFHERLGKQIEPVPVSDTDEVEIRARAVDSLAQDYRETLSNLQRLLNSELEKLGAQVRDLEGSLRPPVNQQGVRRYRGDLEKTLAVLRATWPDKQVKIEVELKKLRVQQGDRQI
jgi:hypothetical protein